MTVEELDLARAKDVAAKEYGDWRDLDDYSKDVCLEIVRAIRLGDEARGLRVVPVAKITPAMMKAGFHALEDGCPPDQIFRSMAANAPFELMTINECSASPFAPEPEEKG